MTHSLRANAFLFDLDGTLLDTAPEFVYCLNTLLQENNKPLITLEALRPFVSHGTNAMIEFGFQLSRSSALFADLKARFLSLYAKDIGFQTQIFPGIVETITLLEEKKAPWGIVTNKHAAFTDPLVQKFSLFNQARCLISGDTLTVSKPHPAPLLLACEQLGVAPADCWYIGDAQSDVQASHAANMRCAVAKYGYIPLDQNPLDWQANYYLAHANEIALLM